jgi:hypothetical protein
MELTDKEKQEFRKFRMLLLAYDEPGEWYASIPYDYYYDSENPIEWDNADTYFYHKKEKIEIPPFVESYFYRIVKVIESENVISNTVPENSKERGEIIFTIDTQTNELKFDINHFTLKEDMNVYETTIQNILENYVYKPEEYRSEIMGLSNKNNIDEVNFDGAQGYGDYSQLYYDSRLVNNLVDGVLDKFDVKDWDEEYGGNGSVKIDYGKDKITLNITEYLEDEVIVNYKKYKI